MLSIVFRFIIYIFVLLINIMRTLLLLFLPIFTFAQQTYVPDDSLETALINLGYYNILDDSVLTSNITNVSSLDISYSGIADLTGIEDFISLTNLNCNNNLISHLDVSNSLSLTDLNCSANNIIALDFTNNLLLSNVECYNNQITTLDISNNSGLTNLNCENNLINSLDLSNAPGLVYLNCSDNELSSIIISNNLYISQFRCENNNLSTLDLSTVSVFDLDCSFNQLTLLDLSGCYNLFTLNCSNNLLDSLDVSMLTSLFGLFCSENNLKELDVSNNTFLIGLYCDKNELHTLDISHGNLQNVTHNGWSYMFDVRTNPLNCIKVAATDLNWANSNLDYPAYINNTMYFSDSCISSPVNIEYHEINKNLVKIIDILGRETLENSKEILFYIYDDGTIEKKFMTP